ncbi:hypothetical protein [Paraburkholderia tropica]|uniref:hypothetical protein n=1 Tax=Paraburkholderia tropica TaxID=92647 RepID=UPI002AB1CE21|nr:hypothetical protein [Paraburkholderia tropica]
MPIQFSYTTPASGAVAEYHIVDRLSLIRSSKQTIAEVMSYVSANTFAAGKTAVYTQQITIDGLPDDGADAFAFSESSLIAASPTDAVAGTNRYVFAGGALVDESTDDAAT